MDIASINLTNCPSDTELTAFFRADLSRSEMDAIHRHVEACDQCLLFIDRIGEHSDTIVQALSAMSPTIDDEPEYRNLLNQLLQSPESVDSTVSIDELTAEYTARVNPRRRLGEQIGDYELVDVLGSGANGSVYRARHAKLDREFAIKLLAPSGSNRDRSLERFQNELKAVGRLDHRNIVRATNAGEFNGEHFLVMEFVDGIDASTLVRRSSPLSVADAVEIACQAGRGLAAAHQKRMVHRDVKPSNLLFGYDGIVRVLDLGLVSIEDAHEPFAALARGTADYMAPEQWDNYDAVDARADIYSLGCTLFKLLIGHAPYVPLPVECKSKMEAHQFAEVPSMRVRRTDVPLGLDRAVRTMLSKDPQKRFQSMEAALAAMTPYAEGSDLQSVADRLRGRVRESLSDASNLPNTKVTRRNVLTGIAAGLGAVLVGKRFFRSPGESLLQYDVWRPMESTKPDRILSAQTVETPVLVNPVIPEYTISTGAAPTGNCAIYPMGRPIQNRFVMESAISIPSATKAGLFYRYQPEKLVDGTLHPFHAIYFEQDQNGLSLHWAKFDWHYSARESRIKRTELGHADLGQQLHADELLLSLEIGTEPLPKISVAGKTIAAKRWHLQHEGELAVRKNELEQQFDGQIGLFVDHASARFKQPRLKYIE